MLIAQISDCHVVRSGQLAYGRVDTAQFLRNAVAAISALPRMPDVILVTGDLVDSGHPDEYLQFKEIAAALPAPLLPVVGNHDDRLVLADAFNLRARYELSSEFIQYLVDDFPLRILVVDSATAGSAEPSLCAERVSWIKAKLAGDPRPTLIAMHHPPFPCGVAWMEPKVPDWSADFASTVRCYPEIKRVVCGHVHRLMAVSWANTLAMSAPSTAHQVYPDLTSNSPPRLNLEAPGFLLHEWTGAELRSFGVSVPGLGNTIDPPWGS